MEEFPYQQPYPMGGTDGESEPTGCKEEGKPMSEQRKIKPLIPVYPKRLKEAFKKWGQIK